jgi:hypothetical protein
VLKTTTWKEINDHVKAGRAFTWLATQLLGSGFAAVQFHINLDDPELGPFTEPYMTGFGRYTTREKAYAEVLIWADAENIPHIVDPS